jgi:enhancing lycopene biosynthesis protein 2
VKKYCKNKHLLLSILAVVSCITISSFEKLHLTQKKYIIMKVAVILSGCGVYDGSEIHESVLSLLALAEEGCDYYCFAPNIDQHHVIDHTKGEETDEKRNVLIESARIARGEIKALSDLKVSDFDALFFPGGFGVAKNFTKWAFEGPVGNILEELKNKIQEAVHAGKIIGAVCMSPTTLAKALEGSGVSAELTVGTTEEASPYEIDAISQGMESIGAKAVQKSVKEIHVDTGNKIVTGPCYMMNANIIDIRNNTLDVVRAMKKMHT